MSKIGGDMTKAKIVFASMTGNTEQCVDIVLSKLEQLGVDAEKAECTEVSVDYFADADIAIVASYTYGEGELPDEITDFYADLESADLAGKIFGVLGTGDTSYGDLFCAAVEQFEEKLSKAGARKGAASVKIEFAPESPEDISALGDFSKAIAAA
jgi:flavodoxin short chain